MAELFNILTFDHLIGVPNPDIGETYEEVANLTTPTHPAGAYLYALSLSYAFDRANKSVYLRFSIDGGIVWHEFEGEPKDSTDVNPVYYAFPSVVATEGVLTLQVEMRKETGGGVLDLKFIDVWIERKA